MSSRVLHMTWKAWGEGMKSVIALLSSLFAVLATSSVNAALIEREFHGNDCSGYFGTGFDSCTIFVNDMGEVIELSPVIAKYNESLSLSETNDTLFPSVDGSEYSFSNTSSQNKTGTWSYVQGAGDPGTRYWATKAGPRFLLHWEVDDSELLAGGACDVTDYYTLSCLAAAQVVSSGDWTTPRDKSLSHITFYDTSTTVVPVPAAVWLFASGLIGLLGIARRR